MIARLLIAALLLISVASFGQKRPPHPPLPPQPPTHTLPPRPTHGQVVSPVAHQTKNGKIVRGTASSKNNGNHYGWYKQKNKKSKKHVVVKRPPTPQRPALPPHPHR